MAGEIPAPAEQLVALPVGWRLGAHGDPVAVFDYIALRLHVDGTVTWEDTRTTGEKPS